VARGRISFGPYPRPHLVELGTNLSCRNGHYDRLDCANLLFGNPHFPGNAKVGLHSRVTAHGHSRGKVNHEGCLWFEDLVGTGRTVESIKRFGLILWYHAYLLYCRTFHGLGRPALQPVLTYFVLPFSLASQNF
jgi:hypothetical protein